MDRTHPHRQGVTGRKNHTINRVEFFRLCNWLKVKEQAFKESRPLASDVAALFKKETGIDASPRSISDARDTAGVQWPSRGGWQKGDNPSPFAKLKVLAERQETIAKSVVSLYVQLGQPLPEDFRLLVQNYNGDSSV